MAACEDIGRGWAIWLMILPSTDGWFRNESKVVFSCYIFYILHFHLWLHIMSFNKKQLHNYTNQLCLHVVMATEVTPSPFGQDWSKIIFLEDMGGCICFFSSHFLSFFLYQICLTEHFGCHFLIVGFSLWMISTLNGILD